jgi:histidinol phosphatase-like PHP family hydrolase
MNYNYHTHTALCSHATGTVDGYVERAIENGVNIKTLSDILGHSQVQITMDLYCHSSLDLMCDSMNKVLESF